MNSVDFMGVEYVVGEWITDATPPASPGVYNVSCRKTDQSGTYFAHWNGSAWSYAIFNDDIVELIPTEPWETRRRMTGGEYAGDHWHLNGSYRGLLEQHKE